MFIPLVSHPTIQHHTTSNIFHTSAAGPSASLRGSPWRLPHMSTTGAAAQAAQALAPEGWQVLEESLAPLGMNRIDHD